MAAVFPPWSNTAIRIGIALVLVGAVAAIATPMIYLRTTWNTRVEDPVVQPVQFDHRHHYQDDAIDCRYCHNMVERSHTAGMPSVDKCMGCHSQVWNDSPLLEVVRNSYYAGLPIRWRRVHNVPDFVYFNHAIHVNKGVGCVTCHGRVDRMPTVYKVQPLSMQWCLGCHRNPEPDLRPLTVITDMDWDPGDAGEEIGRKVADELGVRKLTHCTTCHR